MSVERFQRFSEPEDGPCQRVLFEFSDGHAVALMTDRHPEVNEEFSRQLAELTQFERKDDFFIMKLPKPVSIEHIKEEDIAPLSAFTLATNGQELMIPTKDIKDSKVTTIPFGLIITGDSAFSSQLQSARLLTKDEPTPFASDKYGDSYNHSFFREPRVIESVPTTITDIITDLTNIGTELYRQGNFEVAAKKYRKAFRYAHSYYPENLDSDVLAKLTQVKTKALLNAAMASIKAHDYKRAVDAANFVLEMPETKQDSTTEAKAYYRRGSATLALGDDEQALADFTRANSLCPDEGTQAAISKCHLAAQRRKEKIKAALKNAF